MKDEAGVKPSLSSASLRTAPTMTKRRRANTARLDPSIFAPPIRELTPKQEAFVRSYVNGGADARAAAIEAGYPEPSASQSASRNLRNPLIQQEIMKIMVTEIGLRAPAALKVVSELAVTARSDYVRLEAAKDLLDRAGYKPPERIDHRLDSGLTVHLDLGPDAARLVGQEGGSKTGEGSVLLPPSHEISQKGSMSQSRHTVLDATPDIEDVVFTTVPKEDH